MITIVIIGLTSIVSFYCFSNHLLFEKLSFSPYLIQRNREFYRFITHGVVHADLGHLVFNMLTLYFFGSELEKGIIGGNEFLIFYTSALIFASLPAYYKQKNNPNYSAVGASGAVSSVLFALVLFNPWATIYIQFFIPLYFVLFAAGYLIYCTYQSKHAKDNVAHDVHLWGALYGLAYMAILHPDSLTIFMEKLRNAPFLG